MKLYILFAGYNTCPNRDCLSPGCSSDGPFTFPMYTYLIDHPQGLVLVDTGIIKDHWFDFQKPGLDVPEELRIDRQLRALGFDPEKIKYVIMSHLHSDHAGGMPYLPNATFIVRREELREAWWPEAGGRLPVGGPYTYADYKDTRNFDYIELPDNADYDVFGDKSIVCIDTKGHSRGHQSVVLNLTNTGKTVLAVDAACLPEQLDDYVMPGGHLYSTEDCIKSIDKLRKLREDGAWILFGHCPDQNKTLKLAPEYYE